MKCVVSRGTTSFLCLVFFFGALLWGSMIHKHTGRWMWQGSTSVVSWSWEKYSCTHTNGSKQAQNLVVRWVCWLITYNRVGLCALLMSLNSQVSGLVHIYKKFGNNNCFSITYGSTAFVVWHEFPFNQHISENANWTPYTECAHTCSTGP